MKNLIANIISARNCKVAIIDEKIVFLHHLQEQLKEYNQLRSHIVDSNGELVADSPFASQLVKHPEMVSTIFYADASKLEEQLNNQIVSLQKLKQRFARKNLSLQVFGWAGGGKSTFIQSISGLNDDVVLTSAGDHCTGAATFIYNADSFRAEVFFYTKGEIVEIFNAALRLILKQHDKPEQSINTFSDIETFSPSTFGLQEDDPDISILMKYSRHAAEISELIDKHCAEKCLIIKDKSQVKQYVAQHDGTLNSEHGHVQYFNYLAVKYVNIYHSFPYSDAGDIVLMDTVGLGSAVNDVATEQNMYQAIADNSDAVVLLYSPKAQGGWRGDEATLSKQLNRLRYADTERKINRVDSKCLFLLLNERKSPTNNNQIDCEEVLNKFQNELHRQETIIVANLKDKQESNEKALKPMLKQLIDNIEVIDRNMTREVSAYGKALYDEYTSFLSSVSSVLISLPEANMDKQFDHLFRDLFDRDIKNAMNDLLEETTQQRMLPSSELAAQLAKLSNNDSVVSYLDEIKPIIEEGITYNEAFPIIYLRAAVMLRHAIPNRFRNVDISLTEQIELRKSRVYDLLATTGRLSSIVKKEDTMTSKEWMQKFIDTIINEDECPAFKKCIQDLMNFQISVDGFLLYRIIKHMDNFDKIKLSAEVSRDQIMDTTLYHLKMRLREAFTNIQDEIRDFTMTPNESVFYNIEAFHLSLCLLPTCREELYYLYKRYRSQIWRSEMEEIQSSTLSFAEWQNTRNLLENYNQESMFTDIIS